MYFHIKSIDEFSRLVNLKYLHNLIILNKQKKIVLVADVYIKFQKLLTATDRACTQLLLYNACWV
jgi:hypothetical protein